MDRTSKNLVCILLIVLICCGVCVTGVVAKTNLFPTETKTLTTEYYTIFAAEYALLTCTVLYLILSVANKKTAKAVFSDIIKKIAFVLIVAIMTSLLTFGTAYLENKYLLGNQYKSTEIQTEENQS